MATTTFQGIVRSNGGAGKGNATPSVVPAVFEIVPALIGPENVVFAILYSS